MSVIAGGDEEHLGLVLLHGLSEALCGVLVLVISSTGGEGEVQGCSDARSFPGFVGAPGARVVRPLVDGAVEDRRIIIESCLCTVAMVDVEIENGHSVKFTSLDEVSGPNGNIVEQAKAHGPIWFGVVTWWTDGEKAVAESSLHQGIQAGEAAANRMACNVVALWANGRVGVQLGRASFDLFFDPGDVLRRVDQLEVGGGGRDWGDGLEGVRSEALGQTLTDGLEALRALGMGPCLVSFVERVLQNAEHGVGDLPTGLRCYSRQRGRALQGVVVFLGESREGYCDSFGGSLET